MCVRFRTLKKGIRRLFGLLTVGLALGVAAGSTAFGGSGRYLGPAIVFEQGGDLYAVGLDGSPVARLTNTRLSESDPAASFDGRKLAFSLDYDGIWTMNLDGSGRRRLTLGDDRSPTWTRDGRAIYFVRFAKVRLADCGSIFRVGADGRGLRRVTHPGTHTNLDPAVSPDGRRIALTEWNACEGGTALVRLRVVDASGRPTGDLAKLPGNRFGARHDYAAPTWSPTGRRIAFLDGSDLRVAARDGSDVDQVARTSQSIWGDYDPPAWSPDGTWLAFTNGRGAKGDLYVVHPDGTGLRRVTKTRMDHNSPTWVYGVPRTRG